MPRNKFSKIAISGSIAFDKIMNFSGCFTDIIIPGKQHQFGFSLVVENLKSNFGGTAGNIAFNLALFQEQPIIFGIAGFDFLPYRNWLNINNVNLKYIREVRTSPTSTAHIITDKKDNQISAFYPCRSIANYASRVVVRANRDQKIDLAVIAPDDKIRMLSYALTCRSQKIPYIFDPGQMVSVFSTLELTEAIKGAFILIGNDYEIALIASSLKIDLIELSTQVEILVVTKGAKGSEIYQGGKKIKIKPAKAKNSCDPTGAGDAYRAGLIKGLKNGYNLKTCGQLAALTAVYTVEKYGTQTHKFSLKSFTKRYYENFKEKINL
jgi:adenosine kinase